MDIGLLDSILRRRPIDLRHTILCHMLRTPLLNNRLLPYGSIITRILRKFNVPLQEPVPKVAKKFGKEAIIVLGFDRCGGKWIKTSSAKNRNTLVAAEDDQMPNDIYPID